MFHLIYFKGFSSYTRDKIQEEYMQLTSGSDTEVEESVKNHTESGQKPQKTCSKSSGEVRSSDGKLLSNLKRNQVEPTERDDDMEEESKQASNDSNTMDDVHSDSDFTQSQVGKGMQANFDSQPNQSAEILITKQPNQTLGSAHIKQSEVTKERQWIFEPCSKDPTTDSTVEPYSTKAVTGTTKGSTVETCTKEMKEATKENLVEPCKKGINKATKESIVEPCEKGTPEATKESIVEPCTIGMTETIKESTVEPYTKGTTEITRESTVLLHTDGVTGARKGRTPERCTKGATITTKENTVEPCTEYNTEAPVESTAKDNFQSSTDEDLDNSCYQQFTTEFVRKHFPFRVGYECLLCEKPQIRGIHTYITHEGALEHIKIVHTKERKGGSEASREAGRQKMREKEFVCEYCGKKVRYSLENHMKYWHANKLMHQGEEKVLKCLYCPKEFDAKQQDSFRRHMRGHNEPDVKCKLCGSIMKKRSLKNHMSRKHLKEEEGKEHKCTICPKVFKNKHQLSLHKNYHKKERKFECDQCSKLFLMKHHLQNHLLTHTDNWSFICSICGERFRMKHHLEAHTKRKHNES